MRRKKKKYKRGQSFTSFVKVSFKKEKQIFRLEKDQVSGFARR